MLDANTVQSLSLFGLMLLVCFGYHLMGLAILKRGRTVDVALTTPLSTILAGAGVFMLLATPMVYSGIPIPHSFGIFVVLALIMLITCRRGLVSIPEAKEMNRVLFLMLALTFFPTLSAISSDIVTAANEWQHWLVPSLIQTTSGSLPEIYDISIWQSTALQHPPAWYILPLFNEVSGRFHFSETAIALNFIFCLLALISMVRLCDLRVRWSNVSVITGGLALSFIMLSPFIHVGTLLSVQPDIIAGVALLAVSAPLLSRGELPFKGQVGLVAFAAALLTLSAPDGIFYVTILCLFWLVRSMEQPKLTRTGCMKSTFLIMLAAGFGTGLNKQFVSGMWPWQWQSFYTPDVETLSLIITAIVLLSILVLLSAFKKIQKPESLGLVSLYTLAWLVLFIAGMPVTGGILGFVVLLPFWQFAVTAYAQSKYARSTYSAPWGWGIALMGIAFLAQVFYLPLTSLSSLDKQEPIAAAMGKISTETIAIWDKEHSDTYGRWIFMKTNGKTDYIDARNWAKVASRMNFKAFLKEKGAEYLLITSPDTTISKMLKTALPKEHIFLLKVGEEKFQLVATSLKN